MKENKYGGKLIAIDGPNGSGKSTLMSEVIKILIKKEYDVCVTKEPTTTSLGEYIRKSSETICGNSLACMVAADRYEHLNNEIIPCLRSGKIVITDRYLLSSLILQRIDGVDEQFILNINGQIIKPDLQIAVYADEKIIQKRLAERESLTRFEKENMAAQELLYLDEGVKKLESVGVRLLKIINNDSLYANVDEIVKNVILL